MTDDKNGKPDKKAQRALATLPQSAPYEVGYKKPPAENRFKKGRSGNPRGRPKGAKNKVRALNEERLKSIITEEAYRTIKINEGNKQVTVPMAQAIVRSLAHNAVKGNTRAQRLFSEMLNATEAADKKHHDEWLETAITYKVEWDKELERRKRLGITDLPDPIPHPDDIEIDMRNGRVIIRGPMTKEEKLERDWLIGSKVEWQKELAILKGDLDAENDPKIREFIESEIAFTEDLLNKIEKVLPDPDPHFKLIQKIKAQKE